MANPRWVNLTLRFRFPKFVKLSLVVLLAWWYGYYFYDRVYVSLALFLILLPASALFVYSSTALAIVGAIAFPWLVDAGLSASVTGPYLTFEVLLASFFAYRGRLCDSSLRRTAHDPVTGGWRRHIWAAQWTIAGLFAVSLGFRMFPYITHGSLAALMILVGYDLRPARGFGLPSAIEMFKNSVLLAGSTVIMFLVLEVGVGHRIFPDNRGNAFYDHHPKYLFALRPSTLTRQHFVVNEGEEHYFTYEISSQGIRGREYGPKAADEFRIALIGDSFTFGVTVESEDTLSYALQSALSGADLPFRISVFNLGVSGTGPWQHRGHLLERGFPIEPDLVIHQLFLGNDICDTLHKSDRHLRAYFPGQAAFVAGWQNQDYKRFRVDVFLHAHSNVYHAIRDVAGPLRMHRFLMSGMRFLPRIEETHLAERWSGAPHIEVDLEKWYPQLMVGWEKMLEDIQSTQELCKERGVAYVAFTVPAKEMVIDEVWLEALSLGNGRSYERGKGVRLLYEALEDEGIPFVDVVEGLAGHPDTSQLYYGRDGHLNPEGNRAVALSLREYVLSHYFEAD